MNQQTVDRKFGGEFNLLRDNPDFGKHIFIGYQHPSDTKERFLELAEIGDLMFHVCPTTSQEDYTVIISADLIGMESLIGFDVDKMRQIVEKIQFWLTPALETIGIKHSYSMHLYTSN